MKSNLLSTPLSNLGRLLTTISLALVAGLGCRESPAPPSHIPDNTFLVARFDLAEVVADGLFDGLLEDDEIAETWLEWSEGLENLFGVSPKDILSGTLSAFPPSPDSYRGSTPGIAILVKLSRALDLESIADDPVGTEGNTVFADYFDGDSLDILYYKCKWSGVYTVAAAGVYDDSGSLSAEGTMGNTRVGSSEEDFQLPVTLGAVELKEGDEIEINFEGGGALYVFVTWQPSEKDAKTSVPIYSVHGDSVADFGDNTYMLSANWLTLQSIVGREGNGLDKSMKGLLSEADWSKSMTFAVDIEELLDLEGAEEEWESELEQLGVSWRVARDVRGIRGVLVNLDSSPSTATLSAKVICEDNDAAEEAFKIVEEVISAVLGKRGTSRTVEELLRDTVFEVDGSSVIVELTITKETLKDIAEMVN